LITKQLIDQIEGEASIFFDMKDDIVDFASIAFAHFRGIESILKTKSALDALVITPRVCGICGHAHLMATVRAIEDAYKNAGYPIELSNKVQIIREFTLVMEIVQNHFKWIYLTIIPQLAKLTNSTKVMTPLKGTYGASIASKAIAIFAGQWPHSSYMVPGGITTDPTNIDLLKAESYVDELISFFEKESIGVSLDKFLSFESCKDFNTLSSDISYLESSLVDIKMNKKGFAYDRFLVMAKHSFTKPSKLKQTRPSIVDERYISTLDSYSPHQTSYAQNAQYKNEFYETGPLSRAIATNLPIIKNMHRRFKDSAYSRVMARVFELATLLNHAKELLGKIDISEKSYIKSIDISKITAKGVGLVEAPRGPLIHRVNIENGIILDYKIITPTQFNIGSSNKSNQTPAQKAMTGVTKEEALFIFRTFDVCSVCTTH
jgi:Ni,Fe-hydrogenase I large subunit